MGETSIGRNGRETSGRVERNEQADAETAVCEVVENRVRERDEKEICRTAKPLVRAENDFPIRGEHYNQSGEKRKNNRMREPSMTEHRIIRNAEAEADDIGVG